MHSIDIFKLLYTYVKLLMQHQGNDVILQFLIVFYHSQVANSNRWGKLICVTPIVDKFLFM